MSEPAQTPVLSPAEAQAVVAFSRGFLAAVRTAAMYPPDHPRVKAAIGRFGEALNGALEANVAEAIGVTPSSLLVRTAQAPDDAAVTETAALLHSHGILEIGFDADVPADAVMRLLAVLGRPPASVEGGVAGVWAERGHAAIRIEAVDYREVLEDRDPEQAKRRDDLWRAIVTALASGCQTLDEREQQRLLEIAGDPGELADLARTLMEDKCAVDGSPMVTTQAATVLASFRHLASIARVLAPDRVQEILRNIASALAQLDPRVTMQVVALDAQGGPGSDAMLPGSFSEEGVAQLLATVLALEGQASPRLAEVFDLLVPDPERQRCVLASGREMGRAQYRGAQPFDSFWTSIEELLLSYNEHPYVAGEYRAVLDGAGGDTNGNRPGAAPVAEIAEWLATVNEEQLRETSIVRLADLVRLETKSDRAVVVLNNLGDLGNDLLLGGFYEDALKVLEAIAEGGKRADLVTPAAQTLQRIGNGEGVRETAAVLGDLAASQWSVLARCYQLIGTSCLDALRGLLLGAEETRAAARAGDVFVSMGDGAIALLTSLLHGADGSVSGRVAELLGRIASPAAIPALQGLLRSEDGRVLQAAVRALAAIDHPSASRAIQVALRIFDGRSRDMLVDALVAVADRRVVPMLVRVLENSRPLGTDYQVVLNALEALARLRDDRAVRAVAGVLFQRSWFLKNYLLRRRLRTIRRTAAHALVQIGDGAAAQALERAVRLGDRLLRRVAREALAAASVAGAA